MTLLERFRELLPGDERTDRDLIIGKCPYYYGLTDETDCEHIDGDDYSCEECWGREYVAPEQAEEGREEG